MYTVVGICDAFVTGAVSLAGRRCLGPLLGSGSGALDWSFFFFGCAASVLAWREQDVGGCCSGLRLVGSAEAAGAAALTYMNSVVFGEGVEAFAVAALAPGTTTHQGYSRKSRTTVTSLSS